MFIHSLLHVETLRTCDSANGNFRKALKHVVSSYNNFLKNKTFWFLRKLSQELTNKKKEKHSNDVTQRLIYLKVYQNKRVNMVTFKEETLAELTLDKRLTLFS